jgi:hypothetical protein
MGRRASLEGLILGGVHGQQRLVGRVRHQDGCRASQLSVLGPPLRRSPWSVGLADAAAAALALAHADSHWALLWVLSTASESKVRFMCWRPGAP